MLLRRRQRRPTPEPRDLGLTRVVVRGEDDADARASRLAADARLRRIVAEALIRQDAAEELLAELRRSRDLPALAPRARVLKWRFVELRRELLAGGDPTADRRIAVLASVLRHHLLLLDGAMQLVVGADRSQRVAEELDRLEGLGRPARILEELAAEVLEFRDSP